MDATSTRVISFIATFLLGVICLAVVISPRNTDSAASTAITNLVSKRCEGWGWFKKCHDRKEDNMNCVENHNINDDTCESRNCHGVHWEEASIGLGPDLPFVGQVVHAKIAGKGEAYCMPMRDGKAQGFADGTHCAFDADCQARSLCLGGGLLDTWVGVCTSCPSFCHSDYGCHSCDNKKASIQCNSGHTDFWGQTLGCVPAAAEDDLVKLEACVKTEGMLQAAEYANPAAQSAAQSRLKTCGLSAIAAAQQCLTDISKCSVQFDCLQFSDMVIASGALTALQDSSSGRRMLQIDPIVKDLSKAWLLRNYSKSITLAKGTSKQELGLGYSESEVYSAVVSLAGSAYFTSVLHLRLDFEKGVYSLAFNKCGVQLDISTQLDLGFNAASSSTIPATYSNVREFALTDTAGGPCADPAAGKCGPTTIYSQLLTLGDLPVMVQVQYQVKALVDFTAHANAQFSAQLNYSQFFGFDDLSVSVANGKANWNFAAASFVPDMTHSLHGDASGVIDFKTLVGVELTVLVNGVEAKALVGAWVKLKGSFDIRLALEGTGLTIGSKSSNYCVKGQLNAGIAPGLRIKAGVGLVDALESFTTQCSPKVAKACENQYGRVAECWMNSVTRVDPCAEANGFCETLGREANKLIQAPAAKGYFPLDSDTVGLSVQVSNQAGSC